MLSSRRETAKIRTAPKFSLLASIDWITPKSSAETVLLLAGVRHWTPLQAHRCTVVAHRVEVERGFDNFWGVKLAEGGVGEVVGLPGSETSMRTFLASKGRRRL